MQDLGYLGSWRYEGKTISEAKANGVNDMGQVVGESAVSPTEDHAFLWQSGNGMQDLGTLGGYNSSATGINNAGQVVGDSDGRDLPDPPFGFTPHHAFLWQSPRRMQDLGLFAENWGKATAISKDGTVVGFDGWDKRYAILCSGGTIADLNSMVDPALSWHLINANGINDSGQIVGSGKNKTGQFHAFLLTPIPKRSSLLLWSLGIAVFLALAWRLCKKWATHKSSRLFKVSPEVDPVVQTTVYDQR